VQIRPIEPSDGPALVALHESLSATTRHFRFFSPHPHLTETEVVRFSSVDHVDREALVAVDDAGQILAVARFDRTGPDIGEVAFVVADRLQGHGLGLLLLRKLGEWASGRGYHRFEAEVLGDNNRMMRTFRAWARSSNITFFDGVLHLDMEIPLPALERA
jgi:GNAT superfamily N-acetyltransferase